MTNCGDDAKSESGAPEPGSQPPRLCNYPPFFTTLGDDAIDLAAAAELELLPWEQVLLRKSLGETEDGRWAATQVGLLVPRQNGKNIVVEARELAGLFLLEERKILHTAHEFKTAKDAFGSLAARIAVLPELEELCQLPHRTSNEEVSIRMRDGRYCRYIARSQGSGRGFREVDLVVADEAYALTDTHLGALRPTQSAAAARGRAQFWMTSSAGSGSSTVLARVRAQGIAQENPRLLFAEYSCEPDIDITDRRQWAVANPSLGIFITEEFLAEQLDLMGEIEFAREHLGIWDDPRTTAVITPDMWKACRDEDSEVTDPIALAVDVSPDQSVASIAIAGRRPDGLPYVELVARDQGMSWVPEAAARIFFEWDALAVVVDGAGPAGALISAFKELEIEPYVTGPREMAQACGAFFAEVAAQQLRHNGEPELASAVSASRKRAIGESWAWARRDATADITPLVACTLALHGYSRKVSEPAKRQRTGKVW
ncbi:hypothetical protein [Prescottella equi]|uniref:hypothetical protein n=1 Tax=Rhodococcus hoagii TaxID=43767 RepID=UPI0007CD8596|nr:hypothetical protein [Prescottella equi]